MTKIIEDILKEKQKKRNELIKFNAYDYGDILEAINDLKNILCLSIQLDIEIQRHRLEITKKEKIKEEVEK